MASELHVLFRGALPHLKALSRQMAELGFPFKVRYAGGSMELQRGFMSIWFRRDETGVEFDVFEGRAAVEELAGQDVDPRFDRSGNFRWSGDDDEMLAGLCAAAALARLVDGAVFDEQDARLSSADEAIEQARQALQAALKQRRTRRPAARPADIKRFLKALLEERSDLALVDRLLVIRPVRHILRGVLFGRTNDRYRFAIDRLVGALCYTARYPGSGIGNTVGRSLEAVWQPLFEPVLTEALARHVFDRVGQITTLGDLAAYRFDDRRRSTEHVTLMLLSGEQDRAMEYIRQAEERFPSSREWAQAERSRLANIPAVCAEFHAREASSAKALKIQHIWEPSPFPVELPAAERQRRSAEPLFIPRPWIERRPELFREMPKHPGEIVFAMESLDGDNREKTLVAPLTREQAEDRHRNLDPYVLAACLPTGWTVLLTRQGEDRNHPSRSPNRILSSVLLTVYGADVVVHADFSFTFDRESMQEIRRAAAESRLEFFDPLGRETMQRLWLVDVESRPDRNTVWGWQFSDRHGLETIRDNRGEKKATENPLTGADIDHLSFPELGFGDFDTPLAMVLSVLRSRGYGEIA